MAEIGIFVGTMYGNSLLVAEEAEAILTAQEFLELPGSAHSTDATTTPHPGQSTRGIMATCPTLQQPKSRCRQRRTPPPRP